MRETASERYSPSEHDGIEYTMTTESTAATSTNLTETPPAPETPAVTPIESAPSIVTPPDVAPTWVWKVDYLIFALVLVLTFFLASFTATNSDLWLNLAIGQRLSEGTLEFGVDPFSWASEGQDWVHQSWLFSWLVFQIYQQFGGEGLVLVKALLIVAAIGVLSRIGWRESSRWFTLIGLAMAALAMSGRLALQPIVVSLLFLSLTLYVLHRAGVFALRKESEHPTCPSWLWALPVLFALWANLDHWFVLGPMIVGLCWLASGLGRFFSSQEFGCERAGLVPGAKLGLFFGLGLLACLLNPFHVRVFQLPPELAYLLVSVTDSMGISLPDSLVAGGRALNVVRRVDPELATWTISSMSSAYWREPQRGLNAAGLALFPLLLLGLLAFTLVAMIRGNPNAPTLHLGRFLIWLVFGVMALALYRMIPFFVVLAAPLTALTLGEFLHWQQVSASVAVARRDRGLNLARFITVPFLLLLLYLAWPGWLHGTTDFNSPRRVAWKIRPNPSQHQAALALKSLNEQGVSRNVFNTSYELGNYLAWFAPNVKYGMDTRFSVFAPSAADYAKARQALGNPDKPDADWQALFEKHDIDQVALSNYLRSGVLLKFWLNSEHWRQRYIDNGSLVVSWRGPKATWEFEQLIKDLNRQAFGAVPLDQRPPKNGTPQPQTPTFWALYQDGVGPQPVGVGQFNMLEAQYSFHNELFNRPLKDGGPLGTISFLSLSLPSAMPGGFTFPSTIILMTGWSTYSPPDYGPPALPVLMVRSARRAVAENPHDPQAQISLLKANENLRRNQEDRWINYDPRRGAHPANLRDRLRQIQLVASLYNSVQIAPEQWEANYRLAQTYSQQNLLDLALEHMRIAEIGLERKAAEGKGDAKQRDASIKEFRDGVKQLEDSVKFRLSKWKEGKEKLHPLAQADYAFRGPFQDLVNDRPVEMRLGLGKTALDVLLSINPEKLTPDQRVASLILRFELLLAMGRAELVANDLKDDAVRKMLPTAVYAQYQLLAGGALGDYESMDQGAKELQAIFTRTVAHLAPSIFMRPTLQSGSVFGFTSVWQGRLASELLAAQNNELCNLITLRGILALEAGETEKARELFQAALDQSGTQYGFTERPIARRYADLLKEQQR